ncbi:MAG: hypothetical protein KAY27_04400 [Pedobacter sp.]|nr:hypothetical protein [Pedobacter sp.]
MAIVTGGINGPFKGKVGSVFGYTMNGQNIIRGARRKSPKNKRGSVAQNVSRSKFTKMQHFLSTILPFIQVGFNMAGRAKNISAHNAAKSYNMLNAFTAEGEIDYSKVLVSYGNLPGDFTAQVEKDDAGFHVSWTNHAEHNGIRKTDQVMLLARGSKKGFAKMILSGARREDGQEHFTTDLFDSGEQIHIWIAFISDNRQHISTSLYLGEVTN